MTKDKKISVLFVCLGNICRSPMAEAVFTAMVKKRGLRDRFQIDSAGTAAYHLGEFPDKRTIAACFSNGVPVRHQARQVCEEDFYTFDYILCMDEDNLKDLNDEKPAGSTPRIELFGSYSAEKGDRIIKDPYYGDRDNFEANFNQVTRCSEGLLKELGLFD
ncbi:Low molecular weight phosphotyrosine protein phosphatase [Coemansia guatemalensis]|uniref:Low molecular weight phosphotyrosine protein phosphatase n=1 Tax=Coemansia guatemalensis TaxID=2761395 RepID=A0A9W8LUB9_9FUNG|nr:Low molecular weight phosphotyrosine protein phosphatase [Coemansia guatemalensis]